MNQRWRHICVCALIAVASVAVTRLLSGFRFFEILNLKALDAHFVFRGERPASGVVIIYTDQRALDTIPDLQSFWHPYYAQAIRAAGRGGAKVLGLDIAFGVPVDRWEPDHDRVLAEAVTTAPMPVIVAFVPELNTNQKKLPVQVNMISAALGLAGFPNLTDDPDGFIRRQELLEEPVDGMPFARSLPLRVVEKYRGQEATYENGRLMLGDERIPVAANRSIYINYAGGPKETFARHSLADVIAASDDELKKWFQDKIVLLGTDSKSDRFNTPFYTLFSGDEWTTPGVEIHANTIQTILDRAYLIPAPGWARYGAMLAATSATVAVASAGAGRTVLGILTIGPLVALITHLLFRARVMLSTSEIMVAATLTLIAAVIYRFLGAEERKAFFQEAISKFVSRRFAKSLDESQVLGLSGKRAVVTILFTDIRGFTAAAEKMCDEQGPEVLVKVLNEYMGMMAAIVVSFGGTVNKYIGDGILALFSDEDEIAQPGDHAIRAVRCATRMVTAPCEFKTGAGLHTGLVIVGNVGSADKMEYTVLGDTVNLASRLESLNKEHKTRLLMSEATQKALNGSVETTLLGSVPVRGKAVPIKLYTVSALVEEPVHA